MHQRVNSLVPLLQIGTLSHRCGQRPCGVKQSAKSMTLRQSRKSSIMSWPVVELIPQTNNQVNSMPHHIENMDETNEKGVRGQISTRVSGPDIGPDTCVHPDWSAHFVNFLCFSTGLVQLLHRWSSSQTVSDYWGTFCAGGIPMSNFRLTLPVLGFKPTSSRLLDRRFTTVLICPPVRIVFVISSSI